MVYFLLALGAVIALAGAVTVLLIWRRWAAVEPFVQKAWPKPAVALCRACLAAVGVFGKEAVAGTPPGQVDWRWVATATTVFIGWLLWEVADWWAGEKLRLLKATTEQEHRAAIHRLEESHRAAVQDLQHTHERVVLQLEQKCQEATDRADRAGRAGLFRAQLLAALRGLVNTKNQRIRQELKTPTSRVPIQRAREALSPEQHTAFALEQMALFLHRQLPHAEGSIHQNFRVCLYTDSGGVLSPLDGFDLDTKKHHPFTSFLIHQKHFRLDNTIDPAHAVRCLQERHLLIVPDCTTDPSFQYFGEEQRTYLKSMVAYPIMTFRQTSHGEVAAALVIDTDFPGYFREEDRESIEFFMKEFAARLSLEDAIRKIAAP